MNRLLVVFLSLAALVAGQVDYRLKGDVAPLYYNVDLKVYIEDFVASDEDSFVYDGTVAIELTALEDGVSTIVLHKHSSITITAAGTVEDGQFVSFGNTGTFDKVTEKLSFELDTPLNRGDIITIGLAFTGKHANIDDGFYRTSYSSEAGDVWVLSTQFEPLGARRAFPCFDEPSYKALYDIRVTLSEVVFNKGYRVLSNTAVKSVDTAQGKVTYTFERTQLPIASYLMAVIVSDYLSLPVQQFNSSYPNLGEGELKELRTWGTPVYVNGGYGVISNIAGAAVTEIYTRFFGVGFGFGKLDQVAVTNYGGGMENWGLIVYSEFIMSNEIEDRSGVVSLVAHEVGHQWFGDLVTCQWWGMLWVNEGFATYLAAHGGQEINVEGLDMSGFDMVYDLVLDSVQYSLRYDSLPRHAMTFEVNKPSDIAFDAIEYDKAGSVIRMWRHVLGVNAFYKGLGRYLTDNAGAPGNPDLLLAALNSVANESASDLQGRKPSDLFNPWHLQLGYPIINVIRSASDNKTFTVNQFVFTLRDAGAKAEALRWDVPLSYSTDKNLDFENTTARQWFFADQASTAITTATEAKWIVCNNQQTGFYRVNYDIDNWDQLFIVLAANPSLIHKINRAQITDDFFNIARSTARDYLPYQVALKLSTYLRSETEYHPWKAAFEGLQFLEVMLKDDATVYPLFKKYALSLMEGQYERLARSATTLDEQRLFGALTLWACRMGHASCIERTARSLTADKMAAMGRDARKATMCSGIREGSKTAWFSVLKKYFSATSEVERRELIQPLTCTLDANLLSLLLDDTLMKGSRVPPEDRRAFVSSILTVNPTHATTVFRFLSSNMEAIAQSYKSYNPVGEMLYEIAQSLHTPQDLAEMEKLRDQIATTTNPKLQRAEREVEAALELARANAEWQLKRKDQVAQWLRDNYSS